MKKVNVFFSPNTEVACPVCGVRCTASRLTITGCIHFVKRTLLQPSGDFLYYFTEED